MKDIKEEWRKCIEEEKRREEEEERREENKQITAAATENNKAVLKVINLSLGFVGGKS